MSDGLVIVGLTLLVHALAFLAVAWLIERLGWVRQVSAREFLWRSAVIGSLASALLQLVCSTLPAGGSLAPWSRVTIGAAIEPGSESAPARDTVREVPDRAEGAASAVEAVSTSASALASSSHAQVPESTAAADANASAGAITASAPSDWRAAGRAVLILVWLATSVLLLLRLVRAAQGLRALVARAQPIASPSCLSECRELAEQLRIAAPTLRVSEHVASPLATPSGVIVLPVWALNLESSERRALLAHEMAHLQRRDPQWRVGLALWSALLAPLPLAWTALRRLEALAELESDATAARLLGDGRPLATCLAICLERVLKPSFPALAVAMAAPRSALLLRAERLLEGVPVSAFRISTSMKFSLLIAIAVGAIVLPAFVLPRAVALTSAGDSSDGCQALFGTCVSVHIDDNDTITLKHSQNGRRLDYSASGKVTFTDDETAFASVANGAKAVLQETDGKLVRKVEYVGKGAELQVSYWRDGNAQALDADAQAWIAATIPRLLRELGVDVKGRVERLHARGGNAAVLAEIHLIRSDYVKARYVSQLVSTQSLALAELDTLLPEVAAIGSDYEKRGAMSTILRTQKLESTQLGAAMKVVATIGSDYERATLLIESAPRLGQDAALRAAWLTAASELGSDFERRRALTALIDQTEQDQDLLAILAAGASIGSDFEKRELLVAIANKSRSADAIAAGYATAAAGIGSDFERREALLALMRKGKLQVDSAMAVLQAAADIGSDFECRTVLVELVEAMPDDSAVRARVLQIAAKMGEFERQQVEAAVGRARG